MKTQKKIIISFSIVLLAVILFSAIAIINTQKKMLWGEDMYVGDLKKAVKKYYSTNANELIAYDIDTLRNQFGERFSDTDYSGRPSRHIQQYDDRMPIELIKLLDENTACVIYKIKLDDSKNVFAHVIFKRDIIKNGSFFAKDKEEWKKTGEILFTAHKKSVSEYDSLEIGDTVEEAININHSLIADKIFSSGKSFKSYIPCTEGLIILDFKNEDSSELICSKLINKTFITYGGDNNFGALFDRYDILEYN